MVSSLITTDFIFVLVLTLALVLITIEIIVPSFGLLGLMGGYLLINSILSIPNFDNPVGDILISIILSMIISLILFKVTFKNYSNNKLILNSDMCKAKGNKQIEVTNDIIGKQGVVVKTLRPSGEIEIEGKKYDATAFGDFLEKDAKVVVQRIEGSRLVCKRNN